MEDVVVVGGGISGLAVAWELGQRASVLEASSRAGGNIRSDRRSGYLCEHGPSGFLDDAPATLDACARLGVGARVTRANEQANDRFIVRAGQLRKLPSSPLAFLGSDVLSLSGRVRVLLEPLVPPKRDGADEPVSAFAARRIGREAARVLVDALVTGIWAGDADALSLRSALPKLAALERKHGGLVRGMIAERRGMGGAMGPKGRLASFPEGLEELPAAYASALGSQVRLNSRVGTIERLAGGAYRVHAGDSPPVDAAAVVLACPAWLAAPLVAPMDHELSAQLAGIASVPVAVVHLGFARKDATGLRGFGFLIPRGESDSVLGVLLPSNIFPNRAPEDSLLATAMLGGTRDRSAIEATDQALVDRAASLLRTLAGVRAAPRFSLVIRHERAIPQYVIGHAARLGAIEARLRDQPGLFLAGNSYRGIAINSCVAEASSIARSVAAYLA